MRRCANATTGDIVTKQYEKATEKVDIRQSESMAEAVREGQAIYSRWVLACYDGFVYRFPTPFIWRVRTQDIAAHYQRHLSSSHLDVGVGTGLFLDRANFPTPQPRIALLDLNPNSLAVTAQRIVRYRPSVHQANVLDPQSVADSGLTRSFESIGLNYLLHCLPGDMSHKAVVFDNLRPYLASGGVLFGTTLLHSPAQQNALSRRLMSFYNRKGVFHNTSDTEDRLQTALADRFDNYELSVQGCLAFFAARAPI